MPRKRDNGPGKPRKQGDTAVERVSSAKLVAKRMEKSFDPDDLIESLLHSDDPKARLVADMFMDPAFAKLSLYTKCQKVGMTQLGLLDLFCKHQIDVGVVRLHNHMPQILDDIGSDSKNRVDVCWVCDGSRLTNCRGCRGTGQTDSSDGPAPCSTCLGSGQLKCKECKASGQVQTPGDAKARGQALELAGLTGKNQGVTINQQINTGSAAPSLESIVMSGTKKLPEAIVINVESE